LRSTTYATTFTSASARSMSAPNCPIDAPTFGGV
jgi:hypothetical protein